MRKHDKKTKRLDFLWNENAKDSIQKTSIKDHWGCDWFQPDQHSPAFEVNRRNSTESVLDNEAPILKRGASLLTGSFLLDIEKPFVKTVFNPRVTATSIATEDGLSLTPRMSDDVSTSRGSLHSRTAVSMLAVPDGAGDAGRISTGSNAAEITTGSLPRVMSRNSRNSRSSRMSTKSRDSHVTYNEKAYSDKTSYKSTASSMTELYYSAVSSSIGSTDTIDNFFSCSESDEEPENDQMPEMESSASTSRSREHLTSVSEGINLLCKIFASSYLIREDILFYSLWNVMDNFGVNYKVYFYP